MKAAAALLALAWLVLAAVPAAAVRPDEVLSDPALERRARALSQNLRCLVCQNQSIDDSDAGLARDLRLLVRERLAAGDDDAAVIDFVVARYGDYVLLTPPVKPATYALWFGPPLLLAAGGLLIFSAARRRRRDERQRALAPLTRAERARLARLLDGGGDEPPAGRA
ncbi:MAG: cytochrome c-type biogenesis protein [Thalassobaculaceae bacterium]